MLSNCIKVTSKNNLTNKYYSILIYNIKKQNKNTSDHLMLMLEEVLNMPALRLYLTMLCVIITNV